MTQSDKELLLIDLCARLPYWVKVKCAIPTLLVCIRNDRDGIKVIIEGTYSEHIYNIENIKPYLRPMSSMTEEEVADLCELLLDGQDTTVSNVHTYCDTIHCVVRSKIDGLEGRGYTSFNYEIDLRHFRIDVLDWLNQHHFDYRNLIEKGLALPAPPDMYKFD